MSYFTVYKYSDKLYQIKDKLGSLIDLVIGENKALVFDTGYGIGDLKKEIEAITSKPLIVLNSHGHMDHSCGNYQFEKIYIHKKDIPLLKKHNSLKWRIRNVESARNMNAIPDYFNYDNYITQNEGNIELINYNDIIDLGGITCEVINMEGHTRGSIGLFIKEEQLLIASDASCPFVWLFLEESTSLKKYKEMLERVLKLDFANFLVGHGPRLFPKYKMQEFLDVAKKMTLEKSVKVNFNNFDNLNSYCFTEGEMYNQDHCGIVFDPNKLY